MEMPSNAGSICVMLLLRVAVKSGRDKCSFNEAGVNVSDSTRNLTAIPAAAVCRRLREIEEGCLFGSNLRRAPSAVHSRPFALQTCVISTDPGGDGMDCCNEATSTACSRLEKSDGVLTRPTIISTELTVSSPKTGGAPLRHWHINDTHDFESDSVHESRWVGSNPATHVRTE